VHQESDISDFYLSFTDNPAVRVHPASWHPVVNAVLHATPGTTPAPAGGRVGEARTVARSRYSARFRTSAFAVAALPVAGFLIAAANPSAPAAAVLPGSKPSWAAPSADRGATPAGSQFDLRVYLAGQDPAGLAAYAKSVSDPNSSSYQQYMTPAQVNQAFGATHEQISAITSWLTGAGLKVTGTTNEYIAVHGTAAQAQRAFGTSFHQYADGGSTKRAPSSDAKIPASLASAVLGVSGRNREPQRPPKGLAAARQACGSVWCRLPTGCFTHPQ